MTTYGGRSAQYVPGRDVPNKEPPVSKFVVEKLYKVHRLRMKKIEPLVDCHVHVPDFLTNYSKIIPSFRVKLLNKYNMEKECRDF